MLVVFVIVVVGGFVAFGLYLYFSQDRMVFLPTREMEATPADIGLEFEEVMIEVTAGEDVHAWYVPASRESQEAAKAPDASLTPTVLFCHGNGGNISHRLETIECVVRLGANIMLFDYRGYGRSDGSPSEVNLYADAEACYHWLRTEKQAEPNQIVLFGRSLGGAVAIELAVRLECAGLIVESSFTSAKEMGRVMFPYFPVGFLLRYDFDSVEKIGRVNCPVLVTHSADDDIIPYRMGRKLFEKAAEPKRFVTIAGDHNERGYMNDDLYQATIKNLLHVKRFEDWTTERDLSIQGMPANGIPREKP